MKLYLINYRYKLVLRIKIKHSNHGMQLPFIHLKNKILNDWLPFKNSVFVS